MSERVVETKVACVTVSEDRAHVVRRGALRLDGEAGTVRVAGVAPVLADKTLRVTARGARVVRAEVVRRTRRVVDEDQAALAARLAARADDLAREARAADDEVARLAAVQAALDDAARATLAELAADAARGRLPADAAAAAAAFEDDERRVRAELVAAREASRLATRARDDLERRRAALRLEHPARAADVVVALAGAAPGELELTVEYVVPGACWRPQHTATLGDRLRLATDACVWQHTGEAWEDAELRFSTERPSLGREPPPLGDDVLRTQRRAEVIRVEARDDDLETTGLGAGSRPASRVPGIDDGGEVRVLRGAGRATIPSDGQPHLVPIGAFDADAEVALVCLPEQAAAVLLRSRQVNAGATPLLAGPVELVGRGGVVGHTKVPYLSPGERFELGWGPDPHLRVRRTEERTDLEPGLLPTAMLGRAHRVRVHLSNLDDAPRRFEVVERVPVSELAKVVVEFDGRQTSPPATPDDDGFVRWVVDLPGRGRTRLELRYVVKRHRDVVGL